MSYYTLPAHWVFALRFGQKLPTFKNESLLEEWLKNNTPASCQEIQSSTPFLTISHPLYPSALKGKGAPCVLFYQGDLTLLQKTCIAVVGTRYCSIRGVQYAKEIVHYLHTHKVISVSGLAYGIDNIVHRAAHGYTIGILPCGFDARSSTLQETCSHIIEQGGLILSEYLPQDVARKWRYIRRNRIIAWISSILILVEAPRSSGALHTVRYARERVIPVLVVPSSPLEEQNQGGLKLIAMGFPMLYSIKQLALLLNLPVPQNEKSVMSRSDLARSLNLSHKELDIELRRLQINGTLIPISFGNFLWNPS